MAERTGRPEGCALVTGASRGIGAAIAKSLASDGWPVAVNYRSDCEGATAVVAAVEEAGGRAVAMAADVSAPEAPDELFSGAEAHFGVPVLALVNNAGIAADNLISLLGDEEWQSVLDTNLTGAFRLTRRALKPMMRARFGRIINISSVVGLRANPGQVNYAAAKAGLIAMTKTVTVEVARRGITANAVAPGWIDTDMTAGVDSELLSNVPARRAGTPEEVAACVSFLASDAAGYVNGAVLSVDGGLAA
ncbi:MAG: 3-oxoacyl-ACP reductase FabG [Actinomycetota bacterium]|nr:3-oxoacyl-ACP reductase FabG [Actinomycetota bacterium]